MRIKKLEACHWFHNRSRIYIHQVDLKWVQFLTLRLSHLGSIWHRIQHHEVRLSFVSNSNDQEDYSIFRKYKCQLHQKVKDRKFQLICIILCQMSKNHFSLGWRKYQHLSSSWFLLHNTVPLKDLFDFLNWLQCCWNSIQKARHLRERCRRFLNLINKELARRSIRLLGFTFNL